MNAPKEHILSSCSEDSLCIFLRIKGGHCSHTSSPD